MKQIINFLMLIVVVAIGISGPAAIASAQTGSYDDSDREAYIVSRMKTLFSERVVLRKAAGEALPAPTREVTLLLREAAKNIDSYSEASREFLSMFLKRPDDTTNTWPWDAKPLFYLPAPVLTFEPDVGTYPAIGGKFKFHYVTHSTADGGGVTHTTTLAFVQAMAAAFNTVYAKEITDMEYPAPPNDSTSSPNGGDTKMDIYVMDTGNYSIYGYTAMEPVSDTSTENPSFMVMDNDFVEFVTSTQTAEEAMKVTAAHEYHHAVQFGINSDANAWIMEATSTWMEDQVYDSIDDNLQYLNSSTGFFRNPEQSLDSDFQWYNNWIWLEYMTKKWTETSVRSIWVDYIDIGHTAVNAVSHVLLDNNSTLRAAFTEFATKNYSQIGFYDDHTAYVDVDIANASSQTGYNLDYSSASSDIFSAVTLSVDHLAAKYFKLTPGSTISSSDNDTLTIYLKGTADKRIDVVPVVKSASGTYTQAPLSLDAVNYGKVEIADFNQTDTTEVVLVIANYSTDQDATSMLISGGIGEDGAANTGGAEPNPNASSSSSSGGCFIGVLGDK